MHRLRHPWSAAPTTAASSCRDPTTHCRLQKSRAIEEIAFDHETPTLQATIELLAEELGPFEFLREPYMPGNDVVGDLWDVARQQQERVS